MPKNGEYEIYVDIQYNGGLYDLDLNGELSKVNRMFYTKDGRDRLRFYRFPYSNKELNERYKPADESDLEEYGCYYFNEDGSRPFKKKSCEKCERKVNCFLSDEDMIRYGVGKHEV